MQHSSQRVTLLTYCGQSVWDNEFKFQNEVRRSGMRMARNPLLRGIVPG
jgi:hypothetical protein